MVGPADTTHAAPSLATVALAALPGDRVASPAHHDVLGFRGYRAALDALAADDPELESLEVGTVRLGTTLLVGHPAADLDVVVARGRFDVLGGSMGAAHGDRFVAAATVARERRLPLIAVTSSGGARMQEGMVALRQMARAAEVAACLADLDRQADRLERRAARDGGAPRRPASRHRPEPDRPSLDRRDPEVGT